MDASRVLQSFDTLWFFDDVLAPRTNQIDPPDTEPIKGKQRSPELTDRAPLDQHQSPEIDLKTNSGEIGVEIDDKIGPEIVQPPKFGEVESEIGAKIESEIVQKQEPGEIEIKITTEIGPDIGQQQPVFEMVFKTTAAMLENSTENRRVRRRSRRKNTGELNLLRRPPLISPYL